MPNSPHIIRLREPWKREVVSVPGSDDQLLLSRSFNRPTGLGDTGRVLLAVGPTDQAGQVTINDQPLEPPFEANQKERYDITHQLVDRNLIVVILGGAHEFERVDCVQLEIEGEPDA